MEDNKITFNNIESIIMALNSQTKYVVEFRKLDGITIECKAMSAKLRENAMNEMQALSRKIGIIQVATEPRADSDVLFGVQYPELVPVYTEDEMKSMYTDNFKFLLDNIKMKDPKSLTKTVLIENMDRLTKHSITTYCRSNINQYKESVDDYIKSTKYRSKINGWYLEYIDIYLTGSGV